MHFNMKIQPIESFAAKPVFSYDSTKSAQKSRLKRLFERQFTSTLRIPCSDKQTSNEQNHGKDGSSDYESNTLCLSKMVQNFMEECTDKTKGSRNLSSCFSGLFEESSDDELDDDRISSIDACELLRRLVDKTSTEEKNLLDDTANVVEKSKIAKRKADFRQIVSDGLRAIGYDASLCKSRWNKSHQITAGEYEYIDVILEGKRLLIDIDFRSEFEIARSTSSYKSVLQCIPLIFVGSSDRLQQIVSLVSEAARKSLSRKGLHVPPWRKAEYMKAKWLSPHRRSVESDEKLHGHPIDPCLVKTNIFSGEFELLFHRKSFKSSDSQSSSTIEANKISIIVSPWQPPIITPRKREKVITGLSSVLKDKP